MRHNKTGHGHHWFAACVKPRHFVRMPDIRARPVRDEGQLRPVGFPVNREKNAGVIMCWIGDIAPKGGLI